MTLGGRIQEIKRYRDLENPSYQVSSYALVGVSHWQDQSASYEELAAATGVVGLHSSPNWLQQEFDLPTGSAGSALPLFIWLVEVSL